MEYIMFAARMAIKTPGLLPDCTIQEAVAEAEVV